MVGHDEILGMDFMIPDGIRLDLADGTLCLLTKFKLNSPDGGPSTITEFQTSGWDNMRLYLLVCV